MSWWSLDNGIDESTLSHRNRTVLKAFAKRVNQPTRARPEPENYIVWPSLEDLQDLTRYSVYTIRSAKRELIRAGILQPVKDQGAWRHHTPRYRIDPTQLVQDDAAIARQEARRQRRQPAAMPRLEAAEACPVGEPKGGDFPNPSPEKGGDFPHPSAAKGWGFSPPELTNSTNTPVTPNFLSVEPAPTPSEKKLGQGSPSTTKPQETLAPETIAITEELEAWVLAKAPHIPLEGLPYLCERFLQYCRAHQQRNADWVAAFKLWLLERNHRTAAQDRPREVVRDPEREALWREWREQTQAEPRADPADDGKWEYRYNHNPYHTYCQTYHLRDQPCPTFKHEAGPPATDTGPTAEHSTVLLRQLEANARPEAPSLTGLGEVLAAAMSNGHGNGYYHEPGEDPT